MSDTALPPVAPHEGQPRPDRVLGLIRVSPLTRRRLANFKANRRGFWSLWIFLAVFVLTLGAEFLANDKPLLVSDNGSLYVPVLAVYTETEFGGEFATEAVYSDPYVQELILGRDVDGDGWVEGCPGGDPAGCPEGWMVWPLIPFSYDTLVTGAEVPQAPAPPSALNWLGTDNTQRDVLARLIYGLRISILFGLLLTVFSTLIGVAAGAVQGYFGGWTDLTFQRFIEVWAGMPTLYLLIIMSSVIEPSFWALLILLLLFSWMGLVGLVRAEFLRARNFDYVRAARALGQSNMVIMAQHVLPNAMVATITFLPFILTGGITALTGLDYLGLGLPPGSPSIGELLRQGKANPQAPWLGLTAFFALAFVLSLLVFIGEALRDAFDPRKAVGAPAGAGLDRGRRRAPQAKPAE
ncbi:MAG: ABC transporter permease subunit [Gammaproteobacteria bacterium]|jgi:microcin C transport system permease protein|nr:ABC transporter permease subunit [Gammaproteobacteria bacterium]